MSIFQFLQNSRWFNDYSYKKPGTYFHENPTDGFGADTKPRTYGRSDGRGFHIRISLLRKECLKVARRQVFLRALQFSPISFSPPLLNSRLYLRATFVCGDIGQKSASTFQFSLQGLKISAANSKTRIVRSILSFHFVFLPTSAHTIVVLNNGATTRD